MCAFTVGQELWPLFWGILCMLRVRERLNQWIYEELICKKQMLPSNKNDTRVI